jgi:hypothetical protein
VHILRLEKPRNSGLFGEKVEREGLQNCDPRDEIVGSGVRG